MRVTWASGVVGLAIASTLAAGCSREPATPEAARARGEALVREMSDALVKARAFTVQTQDTRTHSGAKSSTSTERRFSVRKPDRVAFTSLGGELDLRGWYADGKLTLVSPNARVWARVKAGATLDDTLDRLAERFEIQMPMADFFYSVPYDALMASGMKGGYVGRESVGDVECAHVSFADEVVEWHLWLPESGERLPRKYRVTAKKMRGQPTSEVLFVNWDLRTPLTDATFVARVPDGFERIAVAARQVESPAAPAVAPAAATGARP